MFSVVHGVKCKRARGRNWDMQRWRKQVPRPCDLNVASKPPRLISSAALGAVAGKKNALAAVLPPGGAMRDVYPHVVMRD